MNSKQIHEECGALAELLPALHRERFAAFLLALTRTPSTSPELNRKLRFEAVAGWAQAAGHLPRGKI